MYVWGQGTCKKSLSQFCREFKTSLKKIKSLIKEGHKSF